jgi:radical SAM superfamily enzyme YgiQ (UPF0313 family)
LQIGFLELSHVFSNQAKLPYSTGCVWSYCRQNPVIASSYTFSAKDWYYVLDEDFSVDETVDKLKHIDILGVSYFIWNVRISDEICQKLKQVNPNVIIVYGGLGMPKHGRCQQFLNERPYVDIIVHNEGELVFENLLVTIAEGRDIKTVNGISTRDFVNPLERRVKDITKMPSPYLDGLFDDLMAVKNHTHNVEAILEPSRGCPYTCTFCEVGDKFFTKVERQSSEKMFAEIDWVSKYKVDYMHIVDNNFGMFPDHMDIAEYIINKRNETGFPNALNVVWAKNKKPFLFDIAKRLQDAKLNKGVTIALQSMHPATLKAIERPAPERKTLKETVDLLRRLKVPAYVELILGLPEESLQSFKDGLYTLIDDIGYNEYITINNLVVLPNTPFGDPEYLDKYKLVITQTAPAFVHHEQPTEKIMQEINDMVTSSSTMTTDDYIDMTVWKWFMLATHFLGWTRLVAIELKKQGVAGREFYDNLFEYTKTHNTILNKEHTITRELIRKVLDRQVPWGRKNLEISNIYWEYEESTSLVIAQNKDLFYEQLTDYVKQYYNVPNLQDIIDRQYHKMKDPYTVYNGDLELWCKECMWWGRRIERFFVGEYLEV